MAPYYSASEQSRWYSNGGPCVRLLESRVGNIVGREVVTVANGTLGLVVALAALRAAGRVRGPMALVPSFTFTATAAACLWAGMEPVFIDIDPAGWHMDPASLACAVNELGDQVGVIVPVTSFGTPPTDDVARRWHAIADRHGLPLLVDAAATFGARQDDGRSVGALADVVVFSMHATKTFAAGEGGLVCSGDPALVATIRSLVNFGFDADRVVQSPAGINAKLAELPAAAALAALDGLDTVLTARRERAARYRSLLSPHVTFQLGCSGSTWQFVPALFPSRRARDSALVAAARRNIECRTYYDPLHRFPAYRGVRRVGDLTHTEEVADRILCLPLAPDMLEEDIDVVCHTVAGAA